MLRPYGFIASSLEMGNVMFPESIVYWGNLPHPLSKVRIVYSKCNEFPTQTLTFELKESYGKRSNISGDH